MKKKWIEKLPENRRDNVRPTAKLVPEPVDEPHERSIGQEAGDRAGSTCRSQESKDFAAIHRDQASDARASRLTRLAMRASISGANIRCTAGSNGGVRLRKKIAKIPRETAPIDLSEYSQFTVKPSTSR
ncbi:MAG TPA: hypothetical protein VMU03_03055 [Gammaproteobacteria bacterium]|nr:hypothetical protein [Gammaproteobacteria bacterium]